MLGRINIATRLNLILAIAATCFTAIAILGVWKQENIRLTERKQQLRSVSELASGVLAYYEEQARSGAMPLEDAQTAAKHTVGKLRYSGHEYFSIYNDQLQMVWHATNHTLNGQDLSNLKDSQGNFIVRDSVGIARSKGAGYTEYLWPRPGSTEPQPKLTYSARFAPWGWTLATGLYIDDLREARMDDLKLLIPLLVMLAALIGVLLVSIKRSIMEPIHQAISIAGTVAHGDLTHRIEPKGRDEVAQLLMAMASMTQSLRDLVGKVQQSTREITHAASEIAQGNQDLSNRTEHQASTLQETASSVEQFSATVRQNADSARMADQLARNASAVAAQGGEMVQQVVGTMQKINESSHRISDIIGVIDGIAFQTNILALNAAVEAARAGEQGRGFAVVAAEVRSLAGRSAAAAKEIKELISASVQRVEQGTRQVDQTGATMQEIVTAIQSVTNIMSEISAASDEQSAGVAQVSEAISQIDQSTQQDAALVEESAAAAAALHQQAQTLQEAVSHFRLEINPEAYTAPRPTPRWQESLITLRHSPHATRQSRKEGLCKKAGAAIDGTSLFSIHCAKSYLPQWRFRYPRAGSSIVPVRINPRGVVILGEAV